MGLPKSGDLRADGEGTAAPRVGDKIRPTGVLSVQREKEIARQRLARVGTDASYYIRWVYRSGTDGVGDLL